MAIPVPAEPFLFFVHELQAGVGEPTAHLISICVVVIPTGVAFDHVADDGGQSGRGRFGECLVILALFGTLPIGHGYGNPVGR